jgi:hypothetical protein
MEHVMADLRIAVESGQQGSPTQRVYLDGHEMSGVRQVRVCGERGNRTASLDLDLDGVSIDPRAVSRIRVIRDDDRADITIEADNIDGPVASHMMPGWTRGPARVYRRPDVFDRARDWYARLVHLDWLVVVGVAYLTMTVLGVLFEDMVLAYANSLRQPSDDQ